MKLQGRNLSNGTRGDDVRLLHHELRLLGFRLIPDATEVHPGIFGPHTLIAVREFQEKAGLEVTGIVDEATARAINDKVGGLSGGDGERSPFLVRGRVTTAAGKPVGGVTVQAFDRDLRSESLLGKATTGAAGRYEMRYGTEAFGLFEKGGADLVVKVLATDGKLLGASSVLFNAPPEAEVDVTLLAEALPTPTLFEEIKKELEPLLAGLEVEDLEEGEAHQDLSFLAGETGFEKRILARFVMAHKLARRAIQAEFWFALLGGSIFQFTETQSLEAQLTAFLDSLPSLDAAAVRKALTRAFNQKEIPESLREKADVWIAAFLTFAARRIVGGEGEPSFVKSALEDAGIRDPRKQETFARLFNEHKALTPELLGALETDPSFQKNEIADLSTSFRLADLTQGDFSVVKMIKEELGVRQPEGIRKLAKKSESEWVGLVKAKHAAGDIKLPFEVGEVAGQAQLPEAEIYGKTLERQFREAFPTAAFSGGLERALQNGGAHGLRHAQELGGFLERHEDFELLNTQVDEVLKTENEPFRLEVKAVQRVFKLAPTFEATDALLADNVHSAQQVYRLGETEFVRRYGDRQGFTKESARLAWNRAANTQAAVLTVVADLKALDFEGLPRVLQNGNQALSTFPNWDKLFQAGDLCECEHCRSVLSPAAYFADLLMFLKDRETHTGHGKVKDVLFRRRPDLGYLELNCDNALTPLPYVDVVCEVLEDVIAAGRNDIELAGFTAMPADPAAAKAAVASALSGAPISLGADFSLSQVDPADPNRWVAHGDAVTYLLKKKATPNFFAEILRNTKASAAELRAYPQYVNLKAYEKLRQARYPMTLPFDLFAEEVRAAVQKTNLQRWDLMRTLRGPAAHNNPTDGEIACEYFGISVDSAAPFDERRLILVADATVAEQQAMWGETGADWVPRTGNVKSFLQKTGLEYNELLALLDLKFVDPDGDMGIHHLDASCDTAKKVIEVLDAAKLYRIHRFLRLWRKLKGWTMWELDLAIHHLGGDALDETFLIHLFDFCEVRTKLGAKVTVEQALALFSDLNTETHFTKLHEKRADGLYQQLFLNRRLIQPLDPAFQLDAGTGDLPVGNTITAHRPVVLAALGIRESDLVLLQSLTKASDGAPYINDDLTLANLSFLWRHAWLSKLLKLKAEDWKVVLKILNQDLLDFASPGAALELLETTRHLKASGFTPDELSWLLAVDRSAKAAVKETDAARFLAALRKELQAIQAENDPERYDFLRVAPPTDVDSLTALLTSLLKKLNRDEAEISLFLRTLRGGVLLEANVQGLPVGFTFPAAITGAPNHIPIQYDEPQKLFRFTGVLTDAQRTTLLNDPSLAAVTADLAYQMAVEELFQAAQTASGDYLVVTIPAAAGVTLPSDHPSIPIRYDAGAQTLSFIGAMTDAELAALKAEPANLATATALDELFQLPRLAVKFYEPVFTEPLERLPPAVEFKAQLPAGLALKISYDAEQRLLRFTGIMSNAERAALDALVPALPLEVAYHVAIGKLATQPQTILPPNERIWLAGSDLDASLPANDTLAKRLANATRRGLGYLSKTFTANAVVRQASAPLGLTEALTRLLLTHFDVMPPIPPALAKTTLLADLTGPFAATTVPVDYATPTLKTTFDGWFWANRVAAIWKKWKITLEELERVLALTGPARLLDFLTLSLDSTGAVAPLEEFLRISRLLKARESLPETGITLLEVLGKLNAGTYATGADFAADVERLNDAWRAVDVEQFVAALDLAYPGDYLLAETWERLRRAFYFLDNLNAGADTVKTFAAATMIDAHSRTLKELLRSKFGTETWLTLCAEIQDVLRERKRDGLSAYLLTQPKPADAPSGKWENTNDLYAYYLLDVEMCSCQLTSRLVQGSGSVQLFVQRCFMGLEPHVKVQADGDQGDSAWRWWKWMRKYRVWEANRKVFLWPENWIEPELRKDKSQFFKDLENELLQNEINPFTVETAFATYLEKLDGVAQLEIAGFYQEDDADNTIIHVFGRTTGAEPHLYYYRRCDYRQWTPWEKVDLDIQGDYLIPAVVNQRLFLFWPVFTEVPDDTENSTTTIPKAPKPNAETSFKVDRAKKRLKMQMAVSDYRQGKWTPKRVSKDADESYIWYDVEIVRKHYTFFPIDRSEVDGRFGIGYSGHSLGSDGKTKAPLSGAFEISGCKGVPELSSPFGSFIHAIRPERASTGDETAFLKWVENDFRDDDNDFTLESDLPDLPDAWRFPVILQQTPWIFKMSPPWHLSYLDRLALDGLSILSGFREQLSLPAGSWLPFFYNDKKRTFFVLPSLWREFGGRLFKAEGSDRAYYPEIKQIFRNLDEDFAKKIETWVKSWDLAALAPPLRQGWEQSLWKIFPQEPAPPYTDEQYRQLSKRWLMRFFRFFLGTWSLLLFQLRQFHFKNFYHPFVCDFAKLVYNPLKGIPALLSRETQLKNSGFSFLQAYQPTLWVVEPGKEEFYPQEVVDFSPDGAYSPYNWELFFHIPLLIANSLSKNQRFEEARDWYHFIFNPIGVESPTPGDPVMSKYWITKPFFETTHDQYVQQRIEDLLRMLAGDTSVPGASAQLKKDLEGQVFDWRTNPFEPHRIAYYRTVAYQKTVVMKYLDNLIAWGDYLFRQDSMESINEATQLYVLAAEILGPRPRKIPPQVKPPVESFNELEQDLDKFSNALIQVENLIPPLPGNGPGGADPAPLPTLYFCIPHNDKMLGYWDTVADRLYKIRHCMNIEGVVRQLALFEPPIDPGALVKAVAAGLDISAALADLNAPLPLYRFNVLLQKANEVCNDVKALGGALLAALEKKDAEALGLLRQSQEIRLLEAVKAVREKQIEEAKENLAGAKKSKELAQIRKRYYESREFMNAGEVVATVLNGLSIVSHTAGTIADVLAGVMFVIPDFSIGASGFGGSPHFAARTGGTSAGNATERGANGLYNIATILDKGAALASTLASFQRRKEEWDFQKDLAVKEEEQVDRSIAAAELRIAVAEKELENHVLQIENSKATDEFMRSKYTSEELYQWQVGQISGVYFQSYRLAYDLAKRAERCFRFELGLQDSSYINFGYWDSLKKGLLSGEKLQYDLRRLESAYLEQNRREFELTKHVSLALLDPLALVKLRETGRCFFNLPEEIFDLDYPGHYFRRIKSVSLTLPCVVGPYTTISCTLRLLKNSIRINTANGDGDDGYRRNIDGQGLLADDPRFIETSISVKSIAASNAQNDSGVFELSFRDERYLPFEGAGAISEWSLELFSDLPANNPDPGNPDFGKPLRQFDYSTLSDAILHVKYTAREDAGPFKNGAISHLRAYFGEEGSTHSLRLFNLRQEFPSQWHRFLNPTNPADGNVFELAMSPDLFSYRDLEKILKVNSIWLLARCTKQGNYSVDVLSPALPAGEEAMALAPVNQYGGLHFSQKDVAAATPVLQIMPAGPPVTWKLKMTPLGASLQEEVEDVLLVLGYEWEPWEPST